MIESAEEKARREKARKVFTTLLEAYGTEPWNWHTRQTPFQILIGTVLSQRTRDDATDRAAQALFAKYPTPRELADAPLDEIERLIEPATYFKTKAPRIKEIGRIVVERYGGETPDDVEELLKLPGVGIKTANCVLVYGFKKPAIPVDVHVHRVSNRIGLVTTRMPEETEKELWKVVPREFILHVNELMVKHGQRTCKPVVPLCYRCPVAALCDYEPKTPEPAPKKRKNKDTGL